MRRQRVMFIELNYGEDTSTVSPLDRPLTVPGPNAETVEIGVHQDLNSGGLVTITFLTQCRAGDERAVIEAVCRAITGSLIGKVGL